MRLSGREPIVNVDFGILSTLPEAAWKVPLLLINSLSVIGVFESSPMTMTVKKYEPELAGKV